MKAFCFIVSSACFFWGTLAFAEDFPKFYGIGDAGFEMAFQVAQKADLRADFSPGDERFDIGIGKIVQNAREPRAFGYDELAHYWKSQAAGKFVCITLDKNNLADEERNKLVSRLSEYLFKCGVRRVRIHQGYGAGVGVLFDQERK